MLNVKMPNVYVWLAVIVAGLGFLASNYACTPKVGQPPPSVGHPPPSVGHPPPSVGHPPPSVGQPPPSVGQPPPGIGQPPPSVGQPPPRVGQPPPGVGPQPPVIYSLSDLRNSASDFDVQIWTERGLNSYRIGEVVVFYIRTNRDSYVTLLNTGTSGKTFRFYPNQYQRSNFCRAGQVVRVPAYGANFAFRLQGPPGIERVKAIATRTSVPLVNQGRFRPRGPVDEITLPESQIAKDISVQLKPYGVRNWDEDEITFRVTP